MGLTVLIYSSFVSIFSSMTSNLHKRTQTLLVNLAPLESRPCLFIVWENLPFFCSFFHSWISPGGWSLYWSRNWYFCEWLHQSRLLPDGWSLFGQSNVPHHGGQLSLIKSQLSLIKSQGPRPASLASGISPICNLCAVSLHSQSCIGQLRKLLDDLKGHKKQISESPYAEW